jgi:hypothetical protein
VTPAPIVRSWLARLRNFNHPRTIGRPRARPEVSLVDPIRTGQSEVPLLGAEDLSNNDMAGIISDVLGKPVGFQQISGEAFEARLTGFGMSEPMAQGMLDMMVAKNEGLDNAEPRTPQSTTPTTFRQWCEDVLKPAVLA